VNAHLLLARRVLRNVRGLSMRLGTSLALGLGSLVLICAGTACMGSIGGDSAEGDCQIPPGRVGLQRLTRAEYNRTVRDLFGVTTAPADAFPPDSLTSGFDNNAKSLTTSPQLAELLLDAAEAVAAEALQNKRSEILVCDPVQEGHDPCARKTLEALALKVYRRPPSQAEIDDLMTLMQFAQAEGDAFEVGVEYALQAMLMAPQFLFRGIPPQANENAPGTVVPLDGYALATRLSYFLWGSTPDDQLLQRAPQLHDRAALRGEFDRLLADPKSSALYDGFVNQWLQLGKLANATPDYQLFPVFTEELRQQMTDEVRLFFEDIRQRDASPLELINGTRTFASEGIAGIYGVTGITGPDLQPVTTDPLQRAGLLTMPAILTMTSGPTAPNIVKRGVWLAETILCASPKPPPDGVPPQPDPMAGESERERLARHRLDPSCASCHDLIDPLGFAFESYDAIGSWRDQIDGEPVDDMGQLPDGTSFTGVVELARLLESREEFRTCISTKLVTYALGRTLSKSEECVVSGIGAEAVTPESKFSDLLWAIVTSDAFQTEQIGGGQ
jgi:hypothetical protein